MRLWGAPLVVRPGAGVLIALGAWRGWQSVHGYPLVDLGSPLPDPTRARTPEQVHAVAEAYANWTAPSLSATIGTGWVLAAAVAGALVVVLSILLHEAGHLAAMRAVGIRPTRVELHAFGGAVRAERVERLRAGTLALVVVAGPLVTGLLALGAYEAAGELGVGTARSIVAHEILMVAWTFNAIALVVNLLPIGATDGGQLLQAARLRLARA